MGKTYNRGMADFDDLVQRSAARRSARKLAELAWGDAAIADQDLRSQPVPRAPTRSVGRAFRDKSPSRTLG